MKNNLTHKHCRQCRRRKPIEEFPMRKARLCTDCTVAFREASVYYHTHKTNPEVIPPGITITADGYNYLSAPDASRADVRPTRRLAACRFASVRYMRWSSASAGAAGIYKDLSEFGSWRIRVCKECDGPTLESLIKHPPKPR